METSTSSDLEKGSFVLDCMANILIDQEPDLDPELAKNSQE